MYVVYVIIVKDTVKRGVRILYFYVTLYPTVLVY